MHYFGEEKTPPRSETHEGLGKYLHKKTTESRKENVVNLPRC